MVKPGSQPVTLTLAITVGGRHFKFYKFVIIFRCFVYSFCKYLVNIGWVSTNFIYYSLYVSLPINVYLILHKIIKAAVLLSLEISLTGYLRTGVVSKLWQYGILMLNYRDFKFDSFRTYKITCFSNALVYFPFWKAGYQVVLVLSHALFGAKAGGSNRAT